MHKMKMNVLTARYQPDKMTVHHTVNRLFVPLSIPLLMGRTAHLGLLCSTMCLETTPRKLLCTI
ncbi:hypothetical protein FHU10_4344 [Serratia fonticola]|uniref:Uncharacterized protein n=1 Tax=Serratia fonticola TaxID=47917 RepID=A0A542D2A0_SERFO|nr:hypothetical protein FHU09_3360 [Serratia fonticola]TQI97208.1 hypothetical protein FHU11_2685 [Serratia fonticola]TVZ71704.1 hypothetical protein FHU10_4344 [Serratia fonticola]